MKSVTIRGCTMFAGPAYFFYASGTTSGQTSGGKPAAAEGSVAKPVSYSAMSAGMATGNGVKVQIAVFRWSSEEPESIGSALKKRGPEQIRNDLQARPEAVYVWTDESLGYSIHYAYRQALSNGSERICGGDRPPAQSLERTRLDGEDRGEYRHGLSILRHRATSDNYREGRPQDVLTSKVAADDTNQTIALENAEADQRSRTYKRMN